MALKSAHNTDLLITAILINQQAMQAPALRLVVRATAEGWARHDGEAASLSFEDIVVAFLGQRRRAA